MALKLEQLEARLQAIIEVKLVSSLPGFRIEDLVVQKLANAMKNNIMDGPGSEKVFPNVFTLVVNPDFVAHWQKPKLIEVVLNSLYIVGEESGIKFLEPPTISIVQDSDKKAKEIDVIASHQLESVEETKGMTPVGEAEDEPDPERIPENAFVIVDGVKVFPLDEPVINIGRRLDNQLVIDDPRISRTHSQVRAIKGRFIIFDLNSTGGTFVNGQRISQSVLYPGDVISLAGVSLVFGQDNPPQRPDLIDTSPFSMATTTDRRTAFLDRKTGNLANLDRITGNLDVINRDTGDLEDKEQNQDNPDNKSE